jgi:hypothetical protein
VKLCACCGKKIDVERRVHRSDTCPHCGADLHSCVQCEFYSENAHNKCREPDSEWVSDREKANFCDFFRFRGGEEKSTERSEEARRKLDKLFGDGGDS